jgi:syntaxin 1B/2/3
MTSHELQPLTPAGADPTAALSTTAFLARITGITSQLSELNSAIANISALHSQIISAPTPQATETLDTTLTSTHHQIAGIRDELQFLTSDLGRTSRTHDASGFSIKSQHLTRVKGEFRGRLQAFQEAEAQSRQSHREQLARQYRIVQPEATDEEIAGLVESASPDTNVFAQATLNQLRGEQAQSTLSAVRQRHAELELIERTMVELAQIMQELDTMVAQQEEVVIQIEDTSEEVVKDLEGGNRELVVATGLAQKVRKHKWICLGLGVLIVAILVLIIVLAVVLPRQATGQA